MYISHIKIDSLWSGMHQIDWTLNTDVNILSGINGMGKTTILKKVIAHLEYLKTHGEYPEDGVHLTLLPISQAQEGAPSPNEPHTAPAAESPVIPNFDVIRSFDRPLINLSTLNKLDMMLATELDFQLFLLQRKYLDYQVNVGNRIISALQSGEPDAAIQAQQLAESKTLFQNLVDELFAETGKRIVRTENEIRFSQIGETLVPYQLSSGEKQMLAILLTVLVEDRQPYVLLMDEPEVSLHVEWQKRLIDTIRQLNPNVQIILTTHSPALIMNGWMDCVTEVSEIIHNASIS